MILSILIILLLLMAAVAGLLYASIVHLTLKKEFEDKEWMDNAEYDYGHDVHYNEDNN